jgi:hypothetical protein
MSSYEFYLNYVQDLDEKDRIAKLREEQDRKEKAEAEEERQRRNLELAKGIDGFEWSPGNRSEECQEIEQDGETDIEVNAAGTKPEKLKKQQEAILKVIHIKKLEPMKIPDGEKGTIQKLCELDYQDLFKASTAFERAWKMGIGELWQMEFHDSYARRGK